MALRKKIAYGVGTFANVFDKSNDQSEQVHFSMTRKRTLKGNENITENTDLRFFCIFAPMKLGGIIIPKIDLKQRVSSYGNKCGIFF